MTGDGKDSSVISEKNGELAALLADRQNNAWEEFLMTGSPFAMAIYLESGGDIDDDIRQILVDILRNGPTLKTRGGKNFWRDYITYNQVELLMSQTPPKVSKTGACKIYAEQTHQELRTVERQYERGEKIYGPDCDIFRRVKKYDK